MSEGMSEELFCWFIPKTLQNSTIEAGFRSNPLPNALAALLGTAVEQNNLLVSPGYLSKTADTTAHFFESFDALLPSGQIGGNVTQKPRISFMRGMATKKKEDVRLGLQSNELAKNTHYFQFDCSAFRRNDSAKNHSKVVFLYNIIKESDDFFTNLSRHLMENMDSEKPIHDIVAEFTENINVNAVSVGSSNFSDRAYFGNSSKSFSCGETDVILFASNSEKSKSPFYGIVHAFGGATGGDPVVNPGDPPWLEARLEALRRSVLSRAFYSGGMSPSDYLKEILRNYLYGWLEPTTE